MGKEFIELKDNKDEIWHLTILPTELIKNILP